MAAKKKPKADFTRYLSGDITNSRGETPVIRNKYQLLVWLFCKAPEKVNWPNETKVAKELYEQHPEPGFWSSLSMAFKLNTLTFFKSPKGITIIEEHSSQMSVNISEPERFKLEPDSVLKIEQTPSPSANPKTLKDFLSS
jgi:hypothetical protein